MSNCPPNPQRTSHLAEAMCCTIPGNLSTGVAELALITAQATAIVHSAQTPLPIRQNFPAHHKPPALTGEGNSAGPLSWSRPEKKSCKTLSPFFLPLNWGLSQPLVHLSLWEDACRVKHQAPCVDCKLRQPRLRFPLQCNQDCFCLPPSICHKLRREVKPHNLRFFP